MAENLLWPSGSQPILETEKNFKLKIQKEQNENKKFNLKKNIKK